MPEQKVRVFSQLHDKTENGKRVCFVRFGLKNANDRVILAPIYNAIGSFNYGLAIVVKDKKMGVINEKGDFVLPLKYDKIENQSRSMSSFFLTKNNVFELPTDGKITVFTNGRCENINLHQPQSQRELV